MRQAHFGRCEGQRDADLEFGDPGYARQDMIFYGPEVQLTRAYTFGIREIENRKVEISR